MPHRQSVAAVAAACAVAVAVARAQQPASITVTGPVALTSAPRDASHGYPFNASTLDLAKQGFVEEEFFIQGAARSYEIPRDQQSNATPAAATHPYKTRIVERGGARLPQSSTARPLSSGRTSPKASTTKWTGFTRPSTSSTRATRGSAVSAQNFGVSALKQWSPGRYASLDVTVGGRSAGDALCVQTSSPRPGRRCGAGPVRA